MMLEIEAPEVPPESPPRASNGTTKQTLSFAAIMVIACNTMNGPGLTTLPNVAYSGGQIAFVVLVYLAVTITVFCVNRLCLIMWQQNPEHHHLGPVLEETDLVALSTAAWKPAAIDPQYASLPVEEHDNQANEEGLGETTIMQSPFRKSPARRLASLAMVGCALALALAQMMLCAKIADSMIVASFGKNCGLGWDASFHCTSNLSMQPFATSHVSTEPEKSKDFPMASRNSKDTAINNGDDDENTVLSHSSPPMCLLTAGLLIASSITVSLGSVDQSSMLTAQYILFACLLLACLQFCRTMNENSAECPASEHPDDSTDWSAPFLWGAAPFDAVGPVLFNFAFVVTVPSLASAAPSGLNSAVRPLGAATLLMGALYCLVGWIGAQAVACIQDDKGSVDDNLLSLVLQGTPSFWDILSVVVFGLSQLAAIPVYCCMGQEVLERHIQLFSVKTNFLLCHVVPWIICMVTYNSALFESFVEWSSLVLLGFSNFSLPLLLEMRLHPEQKHDGVLWIFCLVSSSIAAVIVQQLFGSLFITQIAFLAALLACFKYRL